MRVSATTRLQRRACEASAPGLRAPTALMRTGDVISAPRFKTAAKACLVRASSGRRLGPAHLVPNGSRLTPAGALLSSTRSTAPRYLVEAGEHLEPTLPRDMYHEVRSARGAAHAKYAVTASQQPLRDRVEDLLEDRVAHSAGVRQGDQREREPFPDHGDVACPKEWERIRLHRAQVLGQLRRIVPVPERYGPATMIINGAGLRCIGRIRSVSRCTCPAARTVRYCPGH